MTGQSDIDILASSPTSQQVDEITSRFLSESHSVQTKLQYIISYLQYVIPIYQSLRSTLRIRIRKIFHSISGILNIMGQFKLSKNDVYLVLIRDVLSDPSLLVSLIDSADKVEQNQIKSLFFGSRIYNTFEGKIGMGFYLNVLVRHLLTLSKEGEESPEYLISFLSLHPLDAKSILFNEFLETNNFELLQKSVLKMSLSQRKQFIGKYLLSYLSEKVNLNNSYTAAKILYQLEAIKIESFLLDAASKVDNCALQKAVGLIVRDPLDATLKLLQLWGLEQYIKDTAPNLQKILTRQILILLSYSNPTEKLEISKTRVFLDSITTRLGTEDINNRDFAMMVAKSVTNGEVKFESQDDIFVERLPSIDLSWKIDFNDLYLIEGLESLSLSTNKETMLDSDDESEDDLSEESDDEKEQYPVFLKDLIIIYSQDKMKAISQLLSHTIKLVRQKATFKLEIEYYSEELVSLLAGLINKYNEPGFEELKINAIVSVIVVNPLIISKVVELLFAGDYSLQQRMILLSSISLSARELRGFDDEFITKPESVFPTKELPQRKLIQEIDRSSAIPKIEELNDAENEIISSGKITRISKKLTSPKPQKKPNNFASIAPKFFYPLANAWLENSGISQFNHSEMFVKHYLQTMNLIINAAYPCYGFEDMMEVFQQIRDNTL